MTYDVILVGGGSAGCVLAARLSEERSCRVLLLEAGPEDRRGEIHVPAAFSALFKGPLDWDYQTDAEPALEGRRLYWPRGKVLGGCSSINAMIYIRGHRTDYDGWRARGNEGWGYAQVLPYFKRAEDQARGAGAFHGAGGPLRVEDQRSPHPLTRLFLRACAEVGLRANDDFNGAEQEGVGLYQVTQRRGRRVSAATAYLAPARRRMNLTVLTGAQVTRVLIEGARAAGVEYVQEGRAHQARGGEVVLCGGAVNSPQLLMLSGIGAARHLESVGVRTVIDLPGVGQNLQDHPLSGVNCACRRRGTLDGAGTLWDVARFVLFRRGRLTSNVGEAGGFVRTEAGLPASDVQLYFAPGFFIEHGFVKPGGPGLSVGACLLRPRSRGEVALASADPLARPAIRPRYFTDPEDVRVQVLGLKLARRISRAPALEAVRGAEHRPGEGVVSDEELAGAVRRQFETVYHPVGTCAMGAGPMAVVDAGLRVRGAGGLRVVDASVMPTLVGGNTNAPVIMIAEKAADLILGRAPPREEVV